MEFVEASKILKSRGCGARFVIVGRPDVGNPSSVPLYKLREWDAERIVEYWGYREDMASAIAEASIVCLPSRYREGLPKVILEALATGRPCIATDNSGCREAIRSGYNGLLVPVGNVVALADAIQYLVDNPEERQRMGASGRERAVKEFDERIVIKQTLELYRRLVAAK
jgi:glycosyltransferase involved in cell wall biosynthesis